MGAIPGEGEVREAFGHGPTSAAGPAGTRGHVPPPIAPGPVLGRGRDGAGRSRTLTATHPPANRRIAAALVKRRTISRRPRRHQLAPRSDRRQQKVSEKGTLRSIQTSLDAAHARRHQQRCASRAMKMKPNPRSHRRGHWFDPSIAHRRLRRLARGSTGASSFPCQPRARTNITFWPLLARCLARRGPIGAG
jgi:hypothetical protein